MIKRDSNANRRGALGSLALFFGIVPTTVVLQHADLTVAATDSSKGVAIVLPKAPIQGETIEVRTGDWQAVDLEKLPQTLQGDLIIASKNILAAFDSVSGCASIYTQKGDRLQRRGVILPAPASCIAEYKAIREPADGRIGIEVRAAGENEVNYTLLLNSDGIIELKRGAGTGVTVTEVRTRYAIVPSFIGVDLAFDPRKYTDRDELYIPSMNLYVGLMEGSDCMMVATWAPADHITKLGLRGTGNTRLINQFSIETAKSSLYLAYLECPNVWREEPLKEEYLERHTPIEWKRPFDARWIGRFYVESSEFHYPFYFQSTRSKIWGRYVRDWYELPCWFNRDKTMVHFEKKFPPTGNLLIYFLESYGTRAQATPTILSPVEVMQKALGPVEAKKLLDLEGIADRPLQRNGLAVCAMSDRLGRIFARGNEVKEKTEVERLLGDINTFIRLIRERVMEFDAFARQTKEFLDAGTKADPELAGGFAEIAQRLDEITTKIKNTMPTASLEEVKRWTDQIGRLTDKVSEGSKEKLVVLAHKWRSMAGTQDDLNRDVSVTTIQIMEAAAEAGVASPKCVKLTEQIIARCRQVLRHGCTWEPRRVHVPAITPG